MAAQNTPKALINALNFLTAPASPQIEGLPETEKTHAFKMRDLLRDKNVVGIGISNKVTNDKAVDEPVLCFYVEKKLPISFLGENPLIPPVLALPSSSAVFTDVKEIGRFQPDAANIRNKPISSGYSVGHSEVKAGTVGAIVQKKGKKYILSNSHVLANSGTGKAGDDLLYPGPADHGTKVGKLDSFVPFVTGGAFVNKFDAALGKIDDDKLSEVDYAIYGAKVPFDTIEPARGMSVTKKGRTTDITTAKVVDVHFRFVLEYSVGKVGYTNQVLCERYTDGGDSGSIVVDVDSGKIVGLHFASANGGSVFSPIGPIIKALKFQFSPT